MGINCVNYAEGTVVVCFRFKVLSTNAFLWSLKCNFGTRVYQRDPFLGTEVCTIVCTTTTRIVKRQKLRFPLFYILHKALCPV